MKMTRYNVNKISEICYLYNRNFPKKHTFDLSEITACSSNLRMVMNIKMLRSTHPFLRSFNTDVCGKLCSTQTFCLFCQQESRHCET